jgi:predicted dehydrogenase
MMAAVIRWGILGTGGIAKVFTEDLLTLPGHSVVAVGSRRPETAAAFAERYGIPRAYATYADLAADSGVDVVYVATPHSGHVPAASSCLTAGRAVLVEKPLGVSASEAENLVMLARRHGRFAMEAMWTRFNPVIARLRKLVAEGAVGEVRAIYADFAIAPTYDPAHRLWAPELAGGALLDLGIYPVSFAWMLLGAPDQVRAVAAPAPTGVDANTAIILRFGAGAVALLHCGLYAESPCAATVIGTRGRIEIEPLFYRPSSLTLYRHSRPAETYLVALDGHGYTYEATEVGRCLRAGLTESPLMPLDETVAILRTLDAVRAQIS